MQIYLLIPERGVEQTSAYSCRANTTTRASLKLIGPTGTTPVPGRLGSTHAYTHMLRGFSFQGNWVNTLQIRNQENTSTLDSQKQWQSLESALHGYSPHFPAIHTRPASCNQADSRWIRVHWSHDTLT